MSLKQVKKEMENYMDKNEEFLCNGSVYEDIEYAIKQLEESELSDKEITKSIGDTNLADIYGILLNSKIALQQVHRFHSLVIKRRENYLDQNNKPVDAPKIGTPPII